MAIPWGSIINAGAQVAGSYAANKAAGKVQQAGVTQAQDRNALAGYQTDKSLDMNALVQQYQAQLDKAKGELEQYKTALEAPGQRASNSVRGDLLANLQDVSVGGAPKGVNVVNFGGGLRPSLLSGNSRELGQQMSREALLSEMKGTPTPYSDVKPFDASAITSRTAPDLTALPQNSTLDSIMNNIALYGSMAGAVGTALKKAPKPTVASQLTTVPAGYE